MNETDDSGMSTAELLEAVWRVWRAHARIFVLLMGLPVATLLLFFFAAPLAAQPNPLRYNPIAEQYSRSLDRIIMISASPDALHIYDPLSQTDMTVGLPKTPLCLSVSADGNYAAVGHDRLISYIDLARASVIKTIAVSATVKNLVLGASYAYAFTQGGTGIVSNPVPVNLLSGMPIDGTGFYFDGGNGILNADGSGIYVSLDPSLYSPANDLQRIDVSSGLPGKSTVWPFEGDVGAYPVCPPNWLSADGSRIYNGCGTVANSSKNPALDMSYAQSLPVASIPIVGFAESAALKLVAAISSPNGHPNPSANIDSQLQLFSTDYLNPAGTLSLPPFVTLRGSFTAHGKAAFFSNNSARLYVLVQADSTSNLQNNFGVETIDLANPAPCAPAFNSATASVPSNGSLGSIGITATADCIYRAVSNTRWIQLTTGSYGSGNGTLNWIARPNSSAEPRTGTISLGSQTFTIYQDGAAPSMPPALAGLSFNVTDAAYSRALDKIVAVSANPNELHIYDPVKQSDSIVPLVMPPFAVSVGPGGLHAAVGHDGWISYVDLQAASVTGVFPIATDVHHVLLAENGYIYGFPQRAWSDIYSLALVNGAVTGTSAIYKGRIPRLKPNDHYFYLTDDTGASKWDISQGVANLASSLLGDEFRCGNHWLYEDGSQLISACAKTYSTSDVPVQDLQYSGTLSNATYLTWAANSTALRSTAVIPDYNDPPISSPAVNDTQIQFYSEAHLGYDGSLSIPQFTVAGSAYPAHGQFAFWNSASTQLFAIVAADAKAKLASVNAIYTVDLSQPSSGCSITLGSPATTLPAAGGSAQVSVSSGSNCIWTASSDSPWLTITAGAVRVGSAMLSWSATSNPGTTNRTATVAVAGQTLSVMQLGMGVVPLAVNPAALSFSYAWGAVATPAPQTVNITAATPTFNAAASSIASWLGVTPASGSVPGTLTISVNATGLAVGTYVVSVIVTSSDQQVQTVAVTLTISPQLTASLASLSFQYAPGASTPTVALTISNGANSSYTLNPTAYWLTSSSFTGTLPETVQIGIVPNSVAAGSYTSSIVISAGGQSITIPVTLTVAAPGVTILGIGSAANFTAGNVAPGEIVVIGGTALGPAQLTMFTLTRFGTLPTSLADTQVYFDTYLAPIIYTSATTVAAIVPYEISGRTTTNVQVAYGSTKSPVFPQAVAPTAPNLFTTTYGLNGQLVALNSDYTQNLPTNPVARGSVVILWGTGEGVTSPPGVDGTLVGPRPSQPLANVTATIGGQPAEVIYAGGSPESVEGLLQLNVRVPSNITPGNQVPVSIQIGSATSPPGGTISVQ